MKIDRTKNNQIYANYFHPSRSQLFSHKKTFFVREKTFFQNLQTQLGAPYEPSADRLLIEFLKYEWIFGGGRLLLDKKGILFQFGEKNKIKREIHCGTQKYDFEIYNSGSENSPQIFRVLDFCRDN